MGKSIRLRYDATCCACGSSIPAGAQAVWNGGAKTAICMGCVGATAAGPSVAGDSAATKPIQLGTAGGSARRIADRQQARRDRAKRAQDDATRAAHPVIGNLIVRARDLLAEPEKPTSWQKGAAGEEAAGRRFDGLADEGFVVLHDRLKPGTRWNLDHLIVGPKGVYVIDAKHYSGALEVRSTGTFLRPGPKRAFVNNRPQDKRVKSMGWQVECVGRVVGELVDAYGGFIKPVLCFLGVEVGLTQRAELVGENGVVVTWPARFVKDISREGPLTAGAVTDVAHRLAAALPPALPTGGGYGS